MLDYTGFAARFSDTTFEASSYSAAAAQVPAASLSVVGLLRQVSTASVGSQDEPDTHPLVRQLVRRRAGNRASTLAAVADVAGVLHHGDLYLRSGTDAVYQRRSGGDTVVSSSWKREGADGGASGGGYATVVPLGVGFVQPGAWYFEVTVLSSSSSSDGRLCVGVGVDPAFRPDAAHDKGVGDDASSYAWGANAATGDGGGATGLQHAGSVSKPGSALAAGDVVGCLCDIKGTAANVTFTVNGRAVASASGVAMDGAGCALVPAVSFGPSAVFRWNLGAAPWAVHEGGNEVETEGVGTADALAASQAEAHVLLAAAQQARLGDLVPLGSRAAHKVRISGSTGRVVTGTRGLPTVGLAGVLLTSGRWCYQVRVMADGAALIG